ncbi:copper chaperone PCu(A)C [Pseudomonas cremoricolorata]|uniref:Transporter n=1 Tax=Pseudomonas cremoricolorata TaxID=157783 RepID=A0A089YG89_9PSED|nr:copper chaperone PCu(A)C [Pseudomonas cremoricolorata]AIR90718.1 transporter [Pseudomonas cremoricolorata]
MAVSLHSFTRRLAAVALLSCSISAMADTTVSEPWVRASVPQQQATGAFMVLTAERDSALVSVASPVAKTVQIHQMTMNGDVMGMQQVKVLALPAGKPVTLDPNGYHVMLMGLKQQVKEGEHVPLTLTIKTAAGETQTLKVQAPVRGLTSQSSDHGHDHGSMH